MTTEIGYLETPYLSDLPYLAGRILEQLGMQVEMFTKKTKPLGTQTEMQIGDQKLLGIQVKAGDLAHWWCPKYLNSEPYLTDPYLSGCIRAKQGVQAEMRIVSEADDKLQGMQVDLKIKDVLKALGVQAKMRVDTETPLGMQANMIKKVDLGTQATMVLYNIQQLRILCNFASRGTSSLGGTNWTAIPSVSVADYSQNNLNTDILEQRYQSDNGDIALVRLRCDTGIPQGAFVDTLGILDHNLTTSARVTLQGSTVPNFATIGFSEVLVTELENMYYISPTLPTDAFRYWQLVIEDPTNPDNHIKIGAVVFGSASIVSLRECFDNPVRYGNKHFKDTLETEGFTNVSNDRATRKVLGLNFSQWLYDGGNWRLMQDYFADAKTDLKCLIIPRPTQPSSLAVFAKLVELPVENHQALSDNNHRVGFSLDWDESL